MDTLDAIFGLSIAALVMAVVGLFGLFGFCIYDGLTAETFSLRKDGWTCTASHSEVVPVTTTTGKISTTVMVPSTVCDQWTAR